MPRKDNVRSMRKVLRDAIEYQRQTGPDKPFHRTIEESVPTLERIAVCYLNDAVASYRQGATHTSKASLYKLLAQLAKMLVIIEQEERHGKE